MRSIRKAAWRGGIAGGTLLVVAMAAGGAAHAQPDLHSAMIYYTGPQGAGPQVNALIAQRYEAGITGLEIGANAVEIKGLNPDFDWFVYNSATDNYEVSEENTLLESLAAAHGVDVEVCFLHYYDDTRITLQGQPVFIPGWGGGSATTMAEARVPIYYSNLSRRITHFGTPVARQIHKEVMLALSVDRTFAGTSLPPDGIFLDNSGNTLCNFGVIQEGGHVLEAPDHALIGNPQFQAWFWDDCYGPFLTALKDTLETSATWTQDHRQKYLMINVANFWTDSYASRDVADILFMEFQYDPVRNFWPNPEQSAQHDRLAASAGIRSFYAPSMKTSAPPNPGEISFAEAMLGSLAWNLVSRTDESMLFLFGTANPSAAGWDTLTWRGCVDVVQDQLGSASGDVYTYATGTDPMGQAYTVWGRNFDNGLVLVRSRLRWDDSIEPETAVPLQLSDPLSPVAPSGAIGSPISTISIRNGTGDILLGTPGAPPDYPPVADFSGTPRTGTAPLNVSFTDLSTNSPTSWSWTFGDGGTSTSRNPSHSYASAGTYSVSLTATNAAGSDIETKTGYITVSSAPPPPVANFSGTPRTGTAPLNVSFTDLSTNSPTSWSWTFGDGGTSTSRNPSHSYGSAGTYTVSLTATNAGGSDTETKTGYITVTSAPSPPVANFSGLPTLGNAPLSVSFTDHSTNSPTSWSWAFGDGGTSTTRNPMHLYSASGIYTVSLTATNAGGSDTETKVSYIRVTPPPLAPVADFTGTPLSGSAPLSVSMTDLSSNSPTSWSWTFGDGGTSTERHPNHTYAAEGTYTVSLTATNSVGSDTEIKVDYVTVTATPPTPVPVADFAGTPRSGVRPLSVSFADLSTNTPTSWSWTFGDGGTSSAQNPTHNYAAAGSYTVSLTATNAGGSDTETKISYITASPPTPQLPSAEFAGEPCSGTSPLTVQFSDLSSHGPTSWLWTFGDGEISSVRNPGHVYAAAGTYTVSLTATNSAGSNTETKVDYVTVIEHTPPPPPVAAFSGTPLTGESPLTVVFMDDSQNDPTAWSWDFGDRQGSTAQHPSHTYAAPGSYTVSLSVSSEAGEDSETKIGYITVIEPPPPPAPVADFDADTTSGTAPLTVQFSDLSTNDPTAWSWDFGDDGISSEANPSHTYAAPGSYTVSLSVSSEAGEDGETKIGYITVAPALTQPDAQFLADPTAGTAPLTVSFTDQSTNYPTTWSWDFGDGWYSAARNPSHTYDTPGTYTVRLTAINAAGSGVEVRADCIQVIAPGSPPVADFEGDPLEGVAPLTVDFTDGSTPPPTAWLWAFGDGATSSERNPGHTYDSPGTYTVTLHVSNADGEGTRTRVAYVQVSAPPITPQADFAGTPTNGAAPLAVDFTDLSDNGPTAWSWDFGDGATATAQNPSHIYAAPGAFTVVLIARGAGGETVATKTDYVTVTAPRSETLALTLTPPSPVDLGNGITYVVPSEGHVRLELFSLEGRCLALLDEGSRSAGAHQVPFRFAAYSAGAAFLRLNWMGEVLTRRLILMK